MINTPIQLRGTLELMDIAGVLAWYSNGETGRRCGDQLVIVWLRLMLDKKIILRSRSPSTITMSMFSSTSRGHGNEWCKPFVQQQQRLESAADDKPNASLC